MSAVELVAALGTGLLLGVLPGSHPNTSALLAAVLWRDPLCVLAAAGAHTMTNVLPTTFLGAPPEDAALAALPAHRMLLAGQGRLAHRIVLSASLAGLWLGVLLVLPLKWLFASPLHFGRHVVDAAPWLVLAVALWLVAREPTWRHRASAAVTWFAAGLLASFAFRVPLQALVPLPATAFTPLLAGLFSAAGLVASLAGAARPEPEQPIERLRLRHRRGLRRGIARGLLASALATVVPGLTPGTAAVAARAGGKEDDDARELALVACINTAQTVFTVAWLFLANQPRTGITQLLATDPIPTWTRGAPPTLLAQGLAILLLAGIVGALVARYLEPLGLRLAHAPARSVAAAALLLVTVGVVVLSGPLGLVIFAAALAMGVTANGWGISRLHLTGALALPFLLRAWN